MAESEETLEELSPSRRAAAVALGTRAATKAGTKTAKEATSRPGRVAREKHLKKGVEEATQRKYKQASGRESRGHVAYIKQLLEGKRGSAPVSRQGISKQMIDEIIEDLSPDDLGPDLRKYYDDFTAKSARTLTAIGNVPPSSYDFEARAPFWAKMSQNFTEGLGAGLDPADRYIVARLKALEGNKDAAKLAKGLGEQIFSGVKAGVADMAANPVRTAKTVGKSLAAAFSLVPDLSDILLLTAGVPLMGAKELGSREDFGRQLELIAPQRGAEERQPFSAEQLSGSQRTQIRDYVLNASSPKAAAKELVETRNFITAEALDEIIAE